MLFALLGNATICVAIIVDAIDFKLKYDWM